VRHVLWASLGVLSQGVGRLLTNVVVGRVAGAAVLGSMATVLAVAQVLVSLWPGSLGSTCVKFVAQSRGRGDDQDTVAIRGHLALRTLQSCLLLGLLGALGWAAWGGTWAECVAVAILVLALGSSGLVQGLLYAERRTRTSSVRQTAAAAFSLVVLAAMLAFDHTLSGAWLAMPLAIGLLLFSVSGWPRQRPASMGRKGRELDTFAMITAVGQVSSSGFVQLAVVAAATIDRASAGQFAVAFALCTPLTLVIAPLGLALFPSVNEAVGRGDVASVRRQISVATRFLAYALTGAGGCMVMVREPVIRLVWGSGFQPAADIFVPLLISSIAAAIAVPAVNGMSSAAQRHAALGTAYALVSAVIGVASWFVLMPVWGATGIAVGLLIGRGLFAIAALESVRRLHGLPAWWGLGGRVLLMVTVLVALEVASVPLAIALACFIVVGVAIVLTDTEMRTFLKEQTS
jgi:putative peptidoglycan lipid II flippase